MLKFTNLLGLALCAGLFCPQGTAAQTPETVTVEYTASKDMQLRINNTSQNAYNATLEIREDSNADGFDYGFCGLLGFDFTGIRKQVSNGYKIESVKLRVTTSNTNVSSIKLLPFNGYDWVEASSTTYASMKIEELSEVGELDTKSMTKAYGGNLMYDLHNYTEQKSCYEIEPYQTVFDGDVLTDYVNDALKGTDEGVTLLLAAANEKYTQKLNFFTKDVTSKNYGTTSVSEYEWDAEAQTWTVMQDGDAEQQTTQFAMMLKYLDMDEEQFVKAVAPTLIITYAPSGIAVPETYPVEADVTTANVIRTASAGTTTLTNADGTTQTGVYYSNANNGILYLGCYDFKQLKGIRTNVAFVQSTQKQVALNFATRDFSSDYPTIDVSYLDNNSADIRSSSKAICMLCGTQTYDNGESEMWPRRGAYYYVDLENDTITLDEEEYLQYWQSLNGVSVVDYSTNLGDNSVGVSRFGSRYATAMSSDVKQELFIYITGQSGRVAVSSVTLYFKDNSTLTLPVVAMNDVEIQEQNLTPNIIKASAELDGTPIHNVTLGDVTMTAETLEALGELQNAGISSTARKVSYAMNVSSAKASTLVLPYDAALPQGVTAYTLSYQSGADKATATEVSELKANVPVLINAEQGVYTVEAEGAVVEDVTVAPVCGALTGVYGESHVPQGSYVLQNQSSGLAFYMVNSETFKSSPFRAYLTAEANGVNRLAIDWGSVTGIRETVDGEKADGPVYTLQGVKVADSLSDTETLPKGIYVVKGKKIAVK